MTYTHTYKNNITPVIPKGCIPVFPFAYQQSIRNVTFRYVSRPLGTLYFIYSLYISLDPYISYLDMKSFVNIYVTAYYI